MWNIHKQKKNDINKFGSRKCVVDHNVIVEMTDVKCGLLSKHLFQRAQQHGGFTKPLGNNRFLWKVMPSSYHME